MQYVRTQIYLVPTQHTQLKQMARTRDVSLSEVVREAVTEYLTDGQEKGGFTKDEYMSIVGLGESSGGDAAQEHDHHVAEALEDEHAG